MAVKTKAQLSAGSATIKNETVPINNTAARVGAQMEDMIDSAPALYCFDITQSGSGTPSLTTYLNQLSGAVVWTRSSAGVYIGTLAGAFLAGKVPKIEGVLRNGTSIGSSILNTFTLQRISDNTIGLGTFQNGTPADGLLSTQYFSLQIFL